MSQNDVEIINVKNQTELYCRYDGQSSPQDCYIELDCENRTLYASYNSAIGNSVPARVWYGHNQRFTIPCLSGFAVNELMSEIKPYANEICSGYTNHWNGHNYVAKFTEDAEKAIEELEIFLNNEDFSNSCVQAINADDWFTYVKSYDCNGNLYKLQIDDQNIITAKTTDKQLLEIENNLISTLDNNIIIEFLDKWLTINRDNCISNQVI